MRYRFRLLIMACVMLLLLPCRAHASTLVGSYEIPTDADVVACDFLGYDYNTMDSGLRSLLFNSTVGGGAGTDASPNFAGYAAFRDSLYSPALMGDYQWYSRYDGFMFVNAADKARADIKGAVRWWDEYGSQQSGGDSGAASYPIVSPVPYTGIVGYTYNGTAITGNVINVTFQYLDNLNSQMNSLGLNYYAGLAYYVKAGSSVDQPVYFYASDGPISISYQEVGTSVAGNQSVPRYNITVTTSGSKLYGSPTSNRIANILTSQGNLSTAFSYMSQLVNTETHYNAVGIYTYGAASQSGGGGPTGGPVPPETPTTPEVDEQPTYNNINNFNGSLNIDNSTTGNTEFVIDLSELLDILKTINNNLVSFAEDFHNMWDWWAEEMGVIESDIRTFQDAISTWLQMIYERLGSIGSPNPTTQPTSWLDWLRALLMALVGDLPSSIGGIQQSFSALQRLFPFSIPWDLSVLLGLFVSSPVTPVFDLPFPYSANDVAYIHVDCSQWNGIMSAVRSVELVIFAAALALRTRELIKGVEVE